MINFKDTLTKAYKFLFGAKAGLIVILIAIVTFVKNGNQIKVWIFPPAPIEGKWLASYDNGLGSIFCFKSQGSTVWGENVGEGFISHIDGIANGNLLTLKYFVLNKEDIYKCNYGDNHHNICDYADSTDNSNKCEYCDEGIVRLNYSKSIRLFKKNEEWLLGHYRSTNDIERRNPWSLIKVNENCELTKRSRPEKIKAKLIEQAKRSGLM